MNDVSESIPAPINPITRQKHRHEVFWQITLPLIVVCIALTVLGALAIVAVVQGKGELVSRWADVSLIWLIVPALLGSLIMCVITAGTAYGIIRLVKVLPPYFFMAQEWLSNISILTRQFSNKITEPFIRYHSFVASMKALRRK